MRERRGWVCVSYRDVAGAFVAGATGIVGVVASDVVGWSGLGARTAGDG